jgi:hypothetical protein
MTECWGTGFNMGAAMLFPGRGNQAENYPEDLLLRLFYFHSTRAFRIEEYALKNNFNLWC